MGKGGRSLSPAAALAHVGTSPPGHQVQEPVQGKDLLSVNKELAFRRRRRRGEAGGGRHTASSAGLPFDSTPCGLDLTSASQTSVGAPLALRPPPPPPYPGPTSHDASTLGLRPCATPSRAGPLARGGHSPLLGVRLGPRLLPVAPRRPLLHKEGRQGTERPLAPLPPGSQQRPPARPPASATQLLRAGRLPLRREAPRGSSPHLARRCLRHATFASPPLARACSVRQPEPRLVPSANQSAGRRLSPPIHTARRPSRK